MSALAPVGHNQPPSPLEFADEEMRALSEFLEANPVIESHDQAQAGGLHVERMRKVLGDVEDDRTRQVRPLNEAVARINEKFHAVHNENSKKPGTADKLLTELRRRLTVYAEAEEAARITAAEAARKAAEEAEQLARQAEAKEHEAMANAKLGECTDVGTATIEADAAFSRFDKASRAAAVAEKDVSVRISSSLGGHALSLRTKETLVLVSYNRAIKAIGPNEKIETAILSAARDYRKSHGKLPDGVTDVIERKI